MIRPEEKLMHGGSAVDLSAILSNIRSGEVTTIEEDQAAFPRIGTLGSFGVFVGRFSGESPWEIHRDEELLYVLEGRTEVTLLVDGREVTASVDCGATFIVPARTWHRQSGVVALLAVVPDEGAVSFAEDPGSETPDWT